MKNLIYHLLITITMLSCSSEDNNNGESSYALSNNLDFKVKSDDGTDLLNPNNSNAYLEENIKIYYVKENGDIEEIYYSNLDLPRNFDIVSPADSGEEEEYYMRVFLNSYMLENATTYIEWNETDTDTIKANYNSGNGYMLLSKAWYNNVLVFNRDETNNTIEITK